MAPIQQIKDNPLLALVVALLLAAIGIIGAMNQFSLANIRENQVAAESRLWSKFDRMTMLFEAGRTDLQNQIRDIQKMSICHDRDIAEIRERMASHLKEYERNGGRK